METYGFVMCKQQRGDSAAESGPSTAKCSHGAGDDSISTPKSQAASADCSGSPGRARHSKISRQTIKRIRLRHNITVCNGDRYTVHQLEKQLAQQQKLLTQLAQQNADLKAQHQVSAVTLSANHNAAVLTGSIAGCAVGEQEQQCCCKSRIMFL